MIFFKTHNISFNQWVEWVVSSLGAAAGHPAAKVKTPETPHLKKRLNYFKIVDENKIKNILFEMRTVSLTFT